MLHHTKSFPIVPQRLMGVSIRQELVSHTMAHGHSSTTLPKKMPLAVRTYIVAFVAKAAASFQSKAFDITA